MLAADHLRSAAIRVGVLAANDKRRFGWHNFRHSLASDLVANGTDARTVQDLLRHSKFQTRWISTRGAFLRTGESCRARSSRLFSASRTRNYERIRTADLYRASRPLPVKCLSERC
jgi:hypothetical protein